MRMPAMREMSGPSVMVMFFSFRIPELRC
jgi:hypothetical protein